MVPNQTEVLKMRTNRQQLLKYISEILLEDNLISSEEHVNMLEQIRKEGLNDG